MMLDASGVTSLRLARLLFGFLLLCAASLFASSFACAQATGASPASARSGSIVGIVEGEVALIRQTTRYALAEGVLLNDQDIIETAPGAFAQIELPGGVLVGIGESTRLMLAPRVGKGLTAPPLYLLEGWLKTTAPGAFGYVGPGVEVATQAAAAVIHTKGAQYELFVESGSARLTLRDGSQTVMQLAGGDFAQRREGTTPTVGQRAAPEFVSKVPSQFRDSLPARGEQRAKRNVAPKARGEITYADVAAWLRTEPALRLPLLPLWQSRAADLDFRAGAKADLAQHPEWERYADPEGYARRLAEEAERRRAREAAAAAARARAAAAAAAAAPAPAPGSIPAASGTSTGRGTSQ
ncbi:hypothetical protein [Variovorax sp. J31P207]|uniref:hypothetical protein n=1 Tax=Variovorax sp. J31P207 TaxID=3053510 RepID=UPI00257871CF|nr:hypothetical protein [Variovorax sp. J31P207]MDM0069167.1 hypothetical protein [Variovorax sp. J31P207]